MVARSRQSGRTGAADSLGVRRFERGIGLTAEVGGLSSRPNHGLTTVVTWFFRIGLMWGIGRPSVKRRAGSETRANGDGWGRGGRARRGSTFAERRSTLRIGERVPRLTLWVSGSGFHLLAASCSATSFSTS